MSYRLLAASITSILSAGCYQRAPVALPVPQQQQQQTQTTPKNPYEGNWRIDAAPFDTFCISIQGGSVSAYSAGCAAPNTVIATLKMGTELAAYIIEFAFTDAAANNANYRLILDPSATGELYDIHIIRTTVYSNTTQTEGPFPALMQPL